MQPRSHFFRTGCRWTIPSAALLLSLLLAAASASAQTVTTIFDFNGAKGSNPFLETLTQGRDGKLYGTTYTGGASDLGTVFRLDPSIGREVVIHSFDEPNGSNPGGGLTLASDGNYLGTTQYGGRAGDGVLYEITSGGTYRVIHHFLGGSDGSYPYAPPIQASDGNLYGVTSGGNTQAPTIYKLTPSGVYNVIYTYDKATTGWLVYGLIQGSDGLLYTMSNQGGAHNCGTVVRLTLSGHVKATHPFNCANGGNPVLPLIQANGGNYYGTTFGGGTHNSGVIFKITPSSPKRFFTSLRRGRPRNLRQASCKERTEIFTALQRPTRTGTATSIAGACTPDIPISIPSPEWITSSRPCCSILTVCSTRPRGNTAPATRAIFTRSICSWARS